jgi:hypothetical protein
VNRSKWRTVSGYFLLVVGLIACPFPIVPGIPIVAAGVALLGPDHWLIRRSRVWLAKRGIGRFPKPE